VVVGLLAVVLMVSVLAGWAPRVVGLRVRRILQLAPAANVGFKHVDVPVIAYGVPGVTASELMLMEAPPVFVRVTVLIALVVLTTTLPKLTDVDETVVCATAKAEENRLNIAIDDSRTTLWSFPVRFLTRLDITLSSVHSIGAAERDAGKSLGGTSVDLWPVGAKLL
jgi:hypothetical protein